MTLRNDRKERMKTRSFRVRGEYRGRIGFVSSVRKSLKKIWEKSFSVGVDSTKKGDYREPRTTVSSERSRARGVGWWWKAFDAVATTLASWKRC